MPVPFPRKACPCCKKFVGDPAFYAKLDAMNADLESRGCSPVSLREVSSGYRCEAHNAKKSKSTTGRHPKGQAADVLAAGPQRKGEILRSGNAVGIVSYATLPGNAGLHIDAGEKPWLGRE